MNGKVYMVFIGLIAASLNATLLSCTVTLMLPKSIRKNCFLCEQHRIDENISTRGRRGLSVCLSVCVSVCWSQA